MTRVYNRISQPQAPKGRWLNGRQAMAYLGVSCSTFYRYVDGGFIPYRLRKTSTGGAKRYYNTDDLDKFATPAPINQFANANI